MRRATVLCLCTSVAQTLTAELTAAVHTATADCFMRKLLDRSQEFGRLHLADLDATALGKTTHIVLRARPPAVGSGIARRYSLQPGFSRPPHVAVGSFRLPEFPAFSFPPVARQTPSQILDIAKLVRESGTAADLSRRTEDIVRFIEAIDTKQVSDKQRLLAGEWDLLWTTRNDINIVLYRVPFAQLDRFSQTVDVNQMSLTSLIAYKGGGEIVARGVITGFEEDKCFFEFETATIKAYGTELSIPNSEAGFFETLYVDDEWRVSRDNRGNYFLAKRATQQ
eukprot:gnl/TRDRNA2_/TRDRNA2_83687_c0_seq3.p1 gnl/TRDRNA2_/TRDRNA2_83687_c0~~gnl/TRDRNA2_/TRDRNA2_83687_c0_seq3.p1  ORF type:complete len:281 (+),score=28.23 gnl/TRDRNA2_/TRDRNA2_83687_c0_seq3:26-868(+)